MRKFTSYLLLLGILSIFSNINAQSVNLEINKNDATTQKIALGTLNKLSFSNSNLVVNLKDGSTENIALNNIRNMIFGTISGVNTLHSNDMKITLYPNPASNFIKFKNTENNSSAINIFSINGVLLLSKTLVSETEIIDISQLSKGMYIVKVENQVLKFSKL